MKKNIKELDDILQRERKKEEDKIVDFFLFKDWVTPSALSLIPKKRRRDPKPMIKCILPECNVLTDRGYCCAEHSKRHDQLIRERKSQLKP